MAALEVFLTGLLAKIIRPIIQAELAEFAQFITNAVERRKAFEKYDKEAQELLEEMASASTSEERWAVLQKFKNARAELFN